MVLAADNTLRFHDLGDLSGPRLTKHQPTLEMVLLSSAISNPKLLNIQDSDVPPLHDVSLTLNTPDELPPPSNP